MSDEETPFIYGLEYQTRALTSFDNINENSTIRFIVGTQSLRNVNKIHLVEYSEETNTYSNLVFKHNQGEIWHLSSCSSHQNLITSCYSSVKSSRDGKVDNCCSLFKFPFDISNTSAADEDYIASLEKLADFKSGPDVTNVGRISVWKPEKGDQLLTFENKKIIFWDVEKLSLVSSFTVDNSKRNDQISALRWSNSNTSIVGLAIGNNIYAKDIRKPSNNFVWQINAHSAQVRDFDFNPNQQYYVATCGNDNMYKFWDVRKPSSPAIIMSHHSHWVWSIRYNQFHDQLVLTCGSDSKVILTRVASLASQPFGHLIEEDEEDKKEKEKEKTSFKDEVIKIYEEHEDSVYAVEWSGVDPWTFASLSYDGRLVINKVPKKEKFSLLF